MCNKTLSLAVSFICILNLKCIAMNTFPPPEIIPGRLIADSFPITELQFFKKFPLNDMPGYTGYLSEPSETAIEKKNSIKRNFQETDYQSV